MYHRKYVQNVFIYGRQGNLAESRAYLGSVQYERGTKDNEVFIHGDMVSSKPIDVHGVTAAEVSNSR